MRASAICGWFLAACASSPAPRSDVAVEPRQTQATRTLVPAIRSSEPKELFVDLGPVIFEDLEGLDLQTRLQLEADRLGADGFILEGRGVDGVYAPGALGGFRSDEPLMAAILLTADIIIEGGLRETRIDPDTRTFVRAYRLVRGELHPGRVLDPTWLPAALMERLDGMASLRDQMQLLNRLLVQGDLSPETYAKVRDSLCRTSREAAG